jgi:hypothetical protein
MRKRSVLYVCVTIAAVGLLAACRDPAPVKPSPLSQSEFVGIEVTGPDSLGAGQSAQFVANIRQVDGTTKSATNMPNLRWRSSNTSVMSVSDSGVVTATQSAVGEALITADITPLGAVQGTRKVVIRPKAVVTVALEVTQQDTSEQVSYVVKLSESAGVPATVTELWLTLDEGWSGQCSWTSDKLGPTRLPANGTLALGPLTCGLGPDFNVVVSIWLTDDNGYRTYVELRRDVVR